MCVCVRVHRQVCMLSHISFFATPEGVACQARWPMGFFRKENCSGLPFPPPGDLPDPGIEPMFPLSPALQADCLPTEPLGKLAFSTFSFQRWDVTCQKPGWGCSSRGRSMAWAAWHSWASILKPTHGSSLVTVPCKAFR